MEDWRRGRQGRGKSVLSCFSGEIQYSDSERKNLGSSIYHLVLRNLYRAAIYLALRFPLCSPVPRFFVFPLAQTLSLSCLPPAIPRYKCNKADTAKGDDKSDRVNLGCRVDRYNLLRRDSEGDGGGCGSPGERLKGKKIVTRIV